MVSIVTSSGVTLSTAQSSTAVDDPTSTGLSLSDYISTDAEMTAYTDQIDAVSTSISSNTTMISAYTAMQSYLQKLEDAALTLAGADSQSSTADVFAERTASLASSSSTSASSILSTSISSGTATGTHTVVVDQLATAEQIASSGQTSSTAALSYTGSFVIGAGSDGATVSVTSGMSLTDIMNSINGTSSGVTASIVEVSSTDYILEVSASDTDETIALTDVSGGILSGLGLADGSGNAADVITAAQPAILTVDGITGITRSSNTVDDVISGVTLDLAKSDADTTVTLSITPNTDDVASAISTFVSAYNSWRDFYAYETAVGSTGTASSTSVLFSDGSLRDANETIANAVASLVNNTSLGAIGISLNSDNTLSINTASLTSALSDEFSSVASLFEMQTSSSSSALTLSYDSRSSYAGTLSLSVTTSDGVITSASAVDLATGDTVALSISGTILTAASGSLASGLSFVYSGSTSDDLTFSVSQGIADSVYQTAHHFGNDTDGVVQSEITTLTDEDTTLSSRESALETEANNYYNILLNQYSSYVTKISSANETYKILTEMINSANSSSS